MTYVQPSHTDQNCSHSSTNNVNYQLWYFNEEVSHATLTTIPSLFIADCHNEHTECLPLVQLHIITLD